MVRKRLIIHLTIIWSILFSLTSCITYDSAIDKQLENRRTTTALNGEFENKPIYQTRSSGFIGTSDFGFAIGVYKEADLIRLTFVEDAGLTVTLERYNGIVFEKAYLFVDGLKTDKEGALCFPDRQSAGSHDSPGIGYSKHKFCIFINEENNLVLVQSGGGGGLAGVIPFAVVGNLMSIFPRK